MMIYSTPNRCRARAWNVRHGLLGGVMQTDTFPTKAEAMKHARKVRKWPVTYSWAGMRIPRDVTVSPA